MFNELKLSCAIRLVRWLRPRWRRRRGQETTKAMATVYRRYICLVLFVLVYICVSWWAMFGGSQTGELVSTAPHPSRLQEQPRVTPAIPAITPAIPAITPAIPAITPAIPAITPVLVLTYNRPAALKRVLRQLFDQISTANYSELFPVVVSHDNDDIATMDVLRAYPLTYIRQPDQRQITKVTKPTFNIEGYHRVSRHYAWALNQIVNVLYPEAKTVVILEDDLDLSKDLFDYFSALRGLLLEDDRILCVSGFNDNGKSLNVDESDACRLWYSDFFPGLGWMTTASIIRELLRTPWPPAYWDDWLRHPARRKGRVCIRPEVSKTATFGRVGVSLGQFFDLHLSKIVLNKQPCVYNSELIEALRRERYDAEYAALLADSVESTIKDLFTAEGIEKLNASRPKSVKVVCRSSDQWIRAAQRFNIMNDIRGGVARNSYRGAVPVMHMGFRVFVIPPAADPNPRRIRTSSVHR